MKAIHNIFIIALMLFLCESYTYAQFTINEKPIVYDKTTNTYMISIPESAFGKDYPAAIALDTDSAWTNLNINGQNIEGFYTFQGIEANKEYQLKAEKNKNTIHAKITFTFLPILKMEGDFGYDYANGTISLYTPDDAENTSSYIKAKWRGGSTNTPDKHKRNYKIKTLNEKGKSKDISFLGMREDNNWILDAGQIDLFRLRNRIATELWNDFSTKPYYADKESKAKSGVAGKVVEMILNNEYRGIYALTEAMDRKELKLKKYDEKNKEFHGQLWKVSSWDKAQFWNIDQDYDNTQETWHAFETKYPDIEDVNPTDYSLLYDAIHFVANSDDETFKREVDEYFDIPVLIDYQIFLEVMQAIDNRGKNMYWAVYDQAKDKKLTLAIWDLDATVGQFYTNGTPLHPDLVQPETDIEVSGYHNLYARLYENNVDGYVNQVTERYKELRKTCLSEENLQDRYEKYYNILASSGATQREEKRWSQDTDIGGYALNFKDELSYIKDWIHKRLNFLDTKIFTNTTSISEIKNQTPRKKENKYNMLGQKVDSNYKGLLIIKGKKYWNH